MLLGDSGTAYLSEWTVRSKAKPNLPPHPKNKVELEAAGPSGTLWSVYL